MILTGDEHTYGYIWMTGQTFKKRYYGHQSTFRDEDCRKDSGANNGTALSARVWEMKDKGLTPKIEWDTIDRAFPYQAGAEACDLCRLEKMRIALGTKGLFTKWPRIVYCSTKGVESCQNVPTRELSLLQMYNNSGGLLNSLTFVPQ